MSPSLRGWAGLSFLVPGAHLVALVGSHEHTPSICPVGHEVLVDSGKEPMRAHGAVNVPGATSCRLEWFGWGISWYILPVLTNKEIKYSVTGEEITA